MDQYRGSSVGVVAQYENGYIVCPDYNNAYAVGNDGALIKKFGNPPLPEGMADPDPASASDKKKGESEKENHFANFIHAVRSRKASDLNGPILDGHISSALCHTGNIAYRLGKKMRARSHSREDQRQQGSAWTLSSGSRSIWR